MISPGPHIRAVPQSPERPGGVIALDQVESPVVRAGIAYWRQLAGRRAFPARAQLSPRDMSGLLRNLVLLRLVDGGADYDYRIVGDAHVTAYGFSAQGKLLSEMGPFAPGHGEVLKRLYDRAVRRCEGYGLRGWLERGEAQKQFIYCESAFLPLGPDDQTVDHVLNFSVYVPRDVR